ncbi:hypothetical protein Hanom_Chr15g01406391 [Helianthus anomalus]
MWHMLLLSCCNGVIRMPGRRSSTVGSKRVRFDSRARTRKRRCTILAATYVDLDLTDSSN